MLIDLHCHSHFSDGKLTPAELLTLARNTGITALALTDHDTIDGLAELHAAHNDHSLQIINGIELSASWKKHVIHILGLHIDPKNPELLALIAAQNESRIHRGQEIGRCLEDVCKISEAYAKACDIAGHNRVGRPHFAELLVREGHVSDHRQAFKRYLTRGHPAYVPTQWADVETVVSAIIAAKGIAVIAHPFKYKLTRAKLFELIILFKLLGGTGIEVVSGHMEQSQINEMAGICQRFKLLASTGSDYHGPGISKVGLGQQRHLPPECMADMELRVLK